MPLLYALIKSTKGNATEGHKLIQEGRFVAKEYEKSKTDDNPIHESLPSSVTKKEISKSPEPPSDHNDGNKILDLSMPSNQYSEQSKIQNETNQNFESFGGRKEITGKLFKPYEVPYIKHDADDFNESYEIEDLEKGICNKNQLKVENLQIKDLAVWQRFPDELISSKQFCLSNLPKEKPTEIVVRWEIYKPDENSRRKFSRKKETALS